MRIVDNLNLDQAAKEKLFQSEEACFSLLAGMKWEEGYTCKKCGHDNFCDGKTAYSRRCTRCKNEESATAHTLFHNIKFPITKAFYILFEVANNHKYSIFDIATKIDVRQLVCWNFKNKIEEKYHRLVRFNNIEAVTFNDLIVKEANSPFA